MSNKERLEFLYNPKALLEYDNEKYLLGASIPENISKVLGEVNETREEDLAVEDEIEDREILARLREDPLLIIKRMELKHMKIIEESKKKKNEVLNIKNKMMVRRRSSLSRSPDIHVSRIETGIKNKKHERKQCRSNNSKSYREEKLQNMINYGRMIQSERANKFRRNFVVNSPAQNYSHFSNPYIQELRSEINEKKLSSLEERTKYIKNYKF